MDIQNAADLVDNIGTISAFAAGAWGIIWMGTKWIFRPFSKFYEEKKILLNQIFIEDRQKLNYIVSQFSRNSGSSVLDKIELIQTTLIKIEKRQRAFSDLEQMPIFETNPAQGNIFVNKAYSRVMKTSDRELLNMGWKNFIDIRDRERVIRNSKESGDEGRTFIDSFRMIDTDGQTHEFDCIAYPQLDRDGKFSGYIGSLIEKKHN